MASSTIRSIAKRVARLALLSIPLGLMTIGCCCKYAEEAGSKGLTVITPETPPTLDVASAQDAFSILQQLGGGPYTTIPKVPLYVRYVGGKLVAASQNPDAPYDFVVLSDSNPNAWSLPGGKIAITRGLLSELSCEAELAAILAHEMALCSMRPESRGLDGHLLRTTPEASTALLTTGHIAQGVLLNASSANATLVTSRNRQTTEIDADLMMVDTLIRAGYDPNAALELYQTFLGFSKLQESKWSENYFASHPPSDTRIAAIRMQIQNLATENLVLDEGSYFSALDPLLKASIAYEHLNEAVRLLNGNEPKQAAITAWSGVEMLPQEAQLWGVLGAAWEIFGETDTSEQSYSEAIERNPNVYSYYLGRANQRIKLGQYAEAINDYESSNRLLPTAEAHLNLGHLLQAKGQLDEALKHYKLASADSGLNGRRAGIALARLELPLNPSKYMQMKPSLDAHGFLVLEARNGSPVDIRDLEVAVDLLDEVGLSTKSTRVRFNQVIPQGTQASVKTKLGPYREVADLEPLLKIRPTAALLAE